ncbi:NNP family nitrate/nitrite transporter-like MFS transporter [Caldalkalibacillus uzonensis]|uniref:NNP family nitrate/nitrite transporter-like MFS transporter n=1 Tax=Caldalkalibacillus uzonensis TaxID=353224 RepID=A0ABU0CRN3_9BACI|nr:nitrate/nitrite transporter [Caldalkalibacillus uzonensis]MDQ0339081.1 NNP family nitrate/nitrite transporter-like MFS transporter [Caldalkalibacillus uzonensis]
MKGQKSALILSTIAMIIGFAAWSVFSPIALQIREAYNLTAVQGSILVATPILLGSVARIPMGILTDRYGGRKVYTLTLFFLVIPLVGAGLANSFEVLLFWAFLIGMAGTTFAIGITFVSKWYPPEQQGFALGVTGMGNLGTAVAGFLIPTIAVTLGLPWVFWLSAAAVALMGVVFWLGTQDAPQPGKAKSLGEALSVLRMKETWVLSLLYFLTFGSFVSFGVYLPTLLQELFQLSVVDAGFRAAGFVVLATFMRPVGGWLSDRLGAEKILGVVFIGVVLGALLMSISTNNLFFFSIGCLGVAFLVGAGNGAVFKLVPQVAPENTGAVTGVVGAFGGIGGFFPPILLGGIKDLTGDYWLGFVLLAIVALVCFLVNRQSFGKEKRASHKLA